MKFLGKFDPLKDETVRIMDENGKIINKNLMPKITNEEVLEAYKMMNFSRRQDEIQNLMQRQGRLLSFLTSTGQEACEVAYTSCLDKKTDHYLSGYRNNAAWLNMGQTVRNIMLYWAGNEFGAKSPDNANSLPPNIVIGSQYSMAAGMAYAEKLLKRKGVILTSTGDGETSEGETYEAMNFAKVHELPVVFVVENNKWSISTAKTEQTKSLNFAVKAVATGMPSIKVDGNDFFASYAVIKEVIENTRKGNGPCLVEFDTYRLGPHSSSDAPDVYRPKGEYESQLKFCPLVRLKQWLIDNKLWSDKQQEELDEQQKEFINAEFKWVEENKNYPLEDIFNYTYSELTDDLKKQQKECKEFYNKYPNSAGGHH